MVALVLLAPACSVNLVKLSAGEVSKNQCSDDSECGIGVCSSNICVANQGALSTLLLEITPPTTAAGVGGVRFLQLARNLTRTNEDYEIDLPRVSTVHRFVNTKGCASAINGTLPVMVTLTPGEQDYGLPTVSYVATTELVPVSDACQAQFSAGVGSVQEFTVNVPAGSYDVYVQPSTQATSGADAGPPTPGCSLVPELFRGRTVPVGDSCLSLPVNWPKEVDVDLPWPETATSLAGWTLRIVHPVTGALLSDVAVLHGGPGATPSGTGYTSVLHYSPIGAGDSAQPGQELLRLSPQPGILGPVVQLELSGLEALSSTRRAIVPNLGVLSTPVVLATEVRSAAPTAAGNPVPVRGEVTFTATRLDGIANGVFATFSTTVAVGDDGHLSVDLLPGDYRVDLLPEVGLGFAATETTLSVACVRAASATSPCAPQAAPALLVPAAASVSGVATVPVSGKPLDRASVEALPATVGARRCASGVDAATCGTEPIGVLDIALAQGAFVPRPVSGVIDPGKEGRFDLTEMDCGACKPNDGTLFDVSVRPPDGSGLPWFVRTGVSVDAGHVDLGNLQIPLPIVEHGVVQIPVDQKKPVLVPGALIRAFVIRDAQGAPILNPEDLSSCAASNNSTALSKPAQCIRSVLQVAETRAGDDATFNLVLPPDLE